ncbi:hypothetical protein BJV78DRAFT_1281252 [Lactifluus subvellereus]|nr:hypothetical protein BJV78DRAFT_1281252 [Lactifluus subvellereus]
MASVISLDANEHPIKSVTVFKSNKAEIVRFFTVSLEEGQSKIQICHLLSSIDTESCRVSGLGDAQLFDVVCSVGRTIEEIDSASIAEVIRMLNAKKNVLLRKLNVLDDTSDTMVTYSKTLVGDILESTRAELEEEILQVTRQIDMLWSSEVKKQGNADGEATVVIMAKQATNIELRLTYLVRDATWSPAYELHATTEAGFPAPPVSLHYRARVSQSTGEDWTDVELSLSTADMDLSKQTIPVLSATKIRPPWLMKQFSSDAAANVENNECMPYIPVAQGRHRIVSPLFCRDIGPRKRPVHTNTEGSAFTASSTPPGFNSFRASAPGLTPPLLLPQPRMVQPAAPLARSLPSPVPVPVPGPGPAAPLDEWQNLDADDATVEEPTLIREPTRAERWRAHQVSVAVLPFEAKILHVTVPKERPAAYLEASVKNFRFFLLLFPSSVVFVPARLDANEHLIKSVTVFKSNKAEIVRVFNVSLEEGQSKIQIHHLPGSIDTESCRVSGLGDAQLFDVVCSVGRSIEEIDSASTAEVIRMLNVKRDVLYRKLNVLDDTSDTMITYSKSLVGEHVPPGQAEGFFEYILSRSQSLESTRAELEEEILQVTRQLDILWSTELKKQGNADGEATVVIMAKQATNIELRLTYLVRDATWSPAYELHATTEAGFPAPSVSLHYRARVSQSTGEDWTDVELSLSTADMDLSKQTIPVLSATKIRPPWLMNQFCFDATANVEDYMSKPYIPPVPGAAAQPWRRKRSMDRVSLISPLAKRLGPGPPPTATKKRLVHTNAEGTAFMASSTPPGFNSFRASAPGLPPFSLPPPPPMVQPAGPLARSLPSPAPALAPVAPPDEWQDLDADDATVEEPTPIGEPTSVVHESPLALTYHVEGASGVPSDGVPHQVSVAVLPFEAKILHVTVPKERPAAYLEASVKNTSDYRLLPGPVNAFVDDSFVSRTAIAGRDVAPGDTFSCTLGADPATRIRYSRSSKRAEEDARARASAFSEQWAATTYRSCTTVTNCHPFPLRALVLRDGVPITEDDKRVNVILRHPAGLADLEQGEELKVGEQRTVQWCKVVDGKGGKKEGLFEWVFEVGAGAEVTIETEWDVKAPVSLRWVEST